MIITKSELMVDKERYAKAIHQGELFLHPTDTINGLGCNATNDKAVLKLRKIKGNHTGPFSVIAPSKQWIRDNCEMSEHAEKWLSRLPGPYTLIMKLKHKGAISKEVNNGGDTLGIRIPDHWISEFVNFTKVPIITTSANLKGQEYVEDLDELHSDIKNNMTFMIYDVGGRKSPSDIVFLNEEKPRVIKRQ